jgi:hypothetical protein
MTLPIVRTRDEAHLYMDLHPCECGSIETDWDSALVGADSSLARAYHGTCSECGREREFVFALPPKVVMADGWPTFGGEEPSKLLDAGDWLWVADMTVRNLPADAEEARRQLIVATKAIEEIVKFIPDGDEEVPGEAFWSERGREVRDADPGRFRLDRLRAIRDAYRDMTSDGGR